MKLLCIEPKSMPAPPRWCIVENGLWWRRHDEYAHKPIAPTGRKG